MKIVLILLLVFTSTVAHAQVFKCVDKSGKTNYQAKPCQTADKAQELSIKSDPAQEAQGKAKMQMLQLEYDNQKARQDRPENQFVLPGNLSLQQPVTAPQRPNDAAGAQSLQNSNSNPGIVMPSTPAPNPPAQQ